MSTFVGGEKKKLSYFKSVQSELKKVTWTSKEELLFSTKTVILSIFLFGALIFMVDLFIKGSLDGVAAFLKMIFG